MPNKSTTLLHRESGTSCVLEKDDAIHIRCAWIFDPALDLIWILGSFLFGRTKTDN
ncbi:MAG: hypothetical protein K2X81_09310 [Candidatus Obscuribacterales bacterium]|nr:hypothetical protein [Candidatus Obscuribacterales bacterium]